MHRAGFALTAVLMTCSSVAYAQTGEPNVSPRSPLSLIFLGQSLPDSSADVLPPPTPLTEPAPDSTAPVLDEPPCDGTKPPPPPTPVNPLQPQLGTVPGYIGSSSGGGMGMAFSPILGHIPNSGGYQAIGFFNSPVQAQNAHLGYLQQDLNFMTPIWQNATDEWYADGRVGVESFDTNAILPNTQQPFPSDLWNISMGTGYRHLFDNGWIGGGSVSVGSASDQPFQSIGVMTVSATGFVRVPSGDRNAWVFGAAMSSNSQVLPYIPIPFAAYLYNPSTNFQAMLGFPFANVIYRPIQNLTLSMSYAILTNFHTRVIYQLAKSWSVFTALDFDSENYWLADRTIADDRFFYYNDRLSAGTQYVLSRNALFQFSGGYVFDRFYFEGTSFTDQNFNRVRIGPGAFLEARVQVRF